VDCQRIVDDPDPRVASLRALWIKELLDEGGGK